MLSACSEAQVESADNIAKVEDSSNVNVAIEVDEFKVLAQRDDVQIIDVRTKKEFDQGNFPNAVNIDFYGNNFREELSKLDRDKKTLIYCHSGGRSGKAAKLMNELNFKEVYDLIGGFSKAGL